VEEVAVDWIAATLAQGQDIPEPIDTAGYSGKLVLRMPKSLHQRATLFAERDGVSLNQFILTCVAERVGSRAYPLALRTQPLQAIANLSIQFIVGTDLLPYSPRSQHQVAASSGEQLIPFPSKAFKEAAHARG
jgi:hypothetical protein